MSGRRRSALALAAAVAGLAIGARAYAAPAQGGQNACFLAGNVQNFSAPDDHTVYIRAGARDIWRLDLMSACLDLPFRQSLGFERAGGDPWICKPVQATIVSRAAGIPQRCPVRAMRRLTPDEIAALPKGVRP